MHIFNHQGFGSSGIARASAFFILLFLLIGCAGGDDDGRRIGDTIVGTWQRGTNPDDVVIEGDSELDPDELPIQKLTFLGDCIKTCKTSTTVIKKQGIIHNIKPNMNLLRNKLNLLKGRVSKK